MRTALILAAIASTASAEVPRGIGVVEWSDGAAPFTPTTTSSGTPLRWGGACVLVRPHSAGAADVDLGAALAAATGGWEAATRACGYLRFAIEAAEAGEVGLDYVNRVIVREDRWCNPTRCYDPGAVGITTLYFVDRPGDPMDGVILDADLELNAVDFALATCDGQPGGCTTAGEGLPEDLASVLAHELGHLLGLDHTCWAGPPADAPLDGDGVRVPPCAPATALPPSVVEATMYNFIGPGEIHKRTPEPDDVGGFCRAYPLAADPMICAPVTPVEGPIDAGVDGGPPADAGLDAAPPDAGCCRTSDRGAPWLAIALAALALRRRRRAR